MSHLVSKYGLSRRELKEFLAEYLKFNVSLGTVFNKQKITNAALEIPVSNLLEDVKQSPSVNADETGHIYSNLSWKESVEIFIWRF